MLRDAEQGTTDEDDETEKERAGRKVTQDKPFIVAQSAPFKVEPGEITIKVQQPIPGVAGGLAGDMRTAGGDVIRREVTVFSTVRHGLGTVTTG
jgi:hypothetical protein